jgi:hypothetical protein
MKKTTTINKEIWSVCGCGGKKDCILCEGTGKFISETFVETIVEEMPEKIDEIIDAEEILPKIPLKSN